MDYNKIRLLLTEKGISFTDFASKIGMSRHGLYAAIDNKTLSIVTLEKISDELGVPVTTFFDLTQLGWVPISEVEKLNNENTRLQNRLKEVEEQLDDKRQLIKLISKYELIDPQTFFLATLDEGGILLTTEEFQIVRNEKPSPSNAVVFEKYEKLEKYMDNLKKRMKEAKKD